MITMGRGDADPPMRADQFGRALSLMHPRHGAWFDGVATSAHVEHKRGAFGTGAPGSGRLVFSFPSGCRQMPGRIWRDFGGTGSGRIGAPSG